MDRLDAMAAFVAAVDRGSLAAASRALGYSPAAVTRAITSLEDRLGAQRLHRTSRALRLTPLGETYLLTCRQVLEQLQRAERGADRSITAKLRAFIDFAAPLQSAGSARRR